MAVKPDETGMMLIHHLRSEIIGDLRRSAEIPQDPKHPAHELVIKHSSIGCLCETCKELSLEEKIRKYQVKRYELIEEVESLIEKITPENQEIMLLSLIHI